MASQYVNNLVEELIFAGFPQLLTSDIELIIIFIQFSCSSHAEVRVLYSACDSRSRHWPLPSGNQLWLAVDDVPSLPPTADDDGIHWLILALAPTDKKLAMHPILFYRVLLHKIVDTFQYHILN